MAFPNNIDLRLGPLGPKIADAIADTDQSPSEWVRDAIAQKLGVEPPTMKEGNLATLRQFAQPKKKVARREKRRK